MKGMISLKKRITAIIFILAFFTTQVYASVLGSQWVEGGTLPFGGSTFLTRNTYLSDQKGVGLQTEYYAEYTPNSAVRPIVVTGDSIWGKRNLSQVMEYMQTQKLYPMIGINASFFSFQTGVPMGHVITNGEITSKDATVLDAVGFRQDGSAFMGRLGIQATAIFGAENYELDLTHINKYCQDSTEVVTLYTDEFGQTTKATPNTINITLDTNGQQPALGMILNGTVEKIEYAPGEVAIPEGKLIMTMNLNGNAWSKSLMQSLSVGDTVTISCTATSDPELWNSAYNALGSEGKQILINGEIAPNLEAGAAPRSAVGVKADGTVLLYVIDGRQKNYSYGVQQKTLASRMKELGCVNALNLDGGGSTTMGGVYPGNEQSSIINSPSDGALRKVTNFIFLQNVQEASGEFGNLFLYPYTAVGLSGTGLQLYPAATDTNNHAISMPENASYQISEGSSKISDSGYLEFWGDEAITVTVTSGEVSGSFTYRSIETPTGLSILNADTGEELTKIIAPADSKLHLNGKATYYNKDLGGVPTAFGWWLSDDRLGTVSEDGTLILSQNAGLSGTLHIQKGAAGFDIPVQISGGETSAELYPYSEIQIEDNALSVDMFCYQSEMDSLNSQILVDGENIVGSESVTAEEIDERHVRYTYPLSGDFMSLPHKIKAIAKTVDGYHGITTKSLTAGIENPFSDMSGHWAGNIVSYMNRQNVLNGSENNGAWYFYPENSMTRAEFAVMISNYLKLSAEESSLDFKDADQIPSWARKHVAAMADAQIISGKKADDGVYFAPNDSITRAEVIAILARTLPDKLRYITPDYTDTAEIPDWALHAFGVFKNSGLLSGYSDGSIRPKNSVTRAEAATLLYNIM